MTQQELDKKTEKLMERFDEVNRYFIRVIAEQVAIAGHLIPSTINMVSIMAQMNSDIASINKKLADAMQKTMPDLSALYQEAMDDFYVDPRFVRALKETPLSMAAKARMGHFTRAIGRQTAETLYNLSNTTLTSEIYRRTIDNAILSVSSGLTDYKSATRRSIRELGYNGMQVLYPSGHHRRLDTAVRQNIIDGANQIAREGSILMGEELGYDAYEISAHARSAPDHEPIQGHVFLKEEFEKMQSEQPFEDVDGNEYEPIRRAIGEWNCMHIPMSFSTKYSIRKFTDDQLKKFIDDNHKGCMIDGKHYTIYEATQLMRRIETETRKQKEVAIAAMYAEDDVLRWECQDKINALAKKYAQVAKAAGVKQRKDRMRVEGFKMMK